MEIKEILKQELGKEVIEKEPMRKHTHIRIGGLAEYFYRARNLDDLIKSVRLAQKLTMPYLIIGGGSNIIVSDAGFEGIIIRNEAAQVVISESAVLTESGITLFALIRKLAESNMGGLEFLAGIPGTLGGAIYGNSGAYGKSMSDLVEIVTILDADGLTKQIKNEDFQFRYRDSILKTRAKISKEYLHRPVILSAQLKVRSNTKEGVLRVVGNYLRIRSKKIPFEPSAGCVFKNIEIAKVDAINPGLRVLAIENKLPVGILIDKSSGKKIRIGKLEISDKHANFIINKGRGKANDYYQLAQTIKNKVKEKFQIELEEEIEYIGKINIEEKGFLKRVFKNKYEG